MTKDREQHELAARAAGLLLLWKTGHCKGGAFEAPFIGDQPWRPKDDDGDALRLFCAMPWMAIETSDIASTVRERGRPGEPHRVYLMWTEWLDEHNGDLNAATRLAIFRAAVELGKAMQASTNPHNVAKGDL